MDHCHHEPASSECCTSCSCDYSYMLHCSGPDAKANLRLRLNCDSVTDPNLPESNDVETRSRAFNKLQLESASVLRDISEMSHRYE
jgi:hypothetical protein